MERHERLQAELALAEDISYIDRARTSFKHFVTYTKLNYELNWHNKLLMDKVQQLIDGKIKKLMVFMPPRHGKSEIVSRNLPAYIFGLNPNAAIIGASYSMTLASMMNRDVQRIMIDPRYNAIFPKTTIGAGKDNTQQKINYLKNNDVFEISGHKGLYRAAGVGTGITGMGFDYGIIDDPFKDQNEAMSESHRNKVWEWFKSTFFTRAHKNSRMLITLTRWHEDDLAGRILENIKNDTKNTAWQGWEILSLPAIATSDFHDDDPRKEGEPLWPKRFDIDDLDKIRGTIGHKWWDALYQQTPTAEGGNMVKEHWWKWYTEMPKKFDEVILSVDATFKGGENNDYVVGQVWGRVKANKYLLDQFRGKMGIIETMNAIRSIVLKWPTIRAKLIEDAANGPAVVEMLKSKISGIIPVSPVGSKESRVNAESDQIESGNCYLPHPSIAPWISDFVDEFNKFPNGKHDDQVDAATQALARLRRAERSGIRALADLD